MYQFNKTGNGWIVALFNNQGIDKTQNGIARVDRTKTVNLEIHTKLNVKEAKEYVYGINIKPLKTDNGSSFRITVEPGDVQVIYFVTE